MRALLPVRGGTARRLAGAALACLALGLLAGTVRAEDGPPALSRAELARAAATRPSVVQVRWRDGRRPDVTWTRSAIVVRADGLVLMAGLPPTQPGTYTVALPDGRALRARPVASDAETVLTLLRVPTAGLVPLPGLAAPAAGADAAPALGTRLLMVAGDGAVAAGPLRARGRHGRFVVPGTRVARPTTGLFAAALAAVDTDAGAPLLDPNGGFAGLVVGRKETTEVTGPVPRGLRVRPTAVEVVAVPAAVVRLVWPLLERHGRLPRAGLGVDTVEVDGALRTQLELPGGGHVIQALTPGGPAARQGLAVHDVLVAVDGRPIPPETTLHDVLLPYRPGTKVTVALIRAGRRLELPLVLGDRDAPR